MSSLCIMGNKKNSRHYRNQHRHVFRPNPRYRSKFKHNKQPSPTKTLPTQNSETLNDSSIVGSRIINIDILQNHISNITIHAAKCGSEMKLYGEEIEGLASIFNCVCVKFGHSIKLYSSEKVQGPRGYKRWECNLAAVWGQVSSGGGHTPLQKTTSLLGVPVMAKKNYASVERDLGEWWHHQLEKSCSEAGQEEKRQGIFTLPDSIEQWKDLQLKEMIFMKPYQLLR